MIVRDKKGESRLMFPDSFVVLDIETTGLSPAYDEIIEIACLRVSGGQVVDTFQSLVKPFSWISEYVTELTGITNEMVADAPPLKDVLPQALAFMQDSVIVGHNVNFDINFIYDYALELCNAPFCNDYVDTKRLSRRLLPELEHHQLANVAAALNSPVLPAHRAESDCRATLHCFNEFKKMAVERYGESILCNTSVLNHKPSLDLRQLTAADSDFDESHLLYGKVCVFTGTLERFHRNQAAQLVVNLGGRCDNGVTKRTNFLILGNNDYCTSIKNGKSSKQQRAEQYIAEGYDLAILPEDEFYALVLPPPVCEYVPTVVKSFFRGNPFEQFVSVSSSDDTVSVICKSLKLFGCERKMGGLLLTVKNDILDGIPLPATAEVKNIKSLKDATRLLLPDEVSPDFKKLIANILSHCPAFIEKNYVPEDTFDCCSRFEKCSDALRCIHPDPLFAAGCSYRKKLNQGIVFCGKNRNID